MAGFVQPVLGPTQQSRSIGLDEVVTSAIFFACAALCFFISQRIAKRLED